HTVSCVVLRTIDWVIVKATNQVGSQGIIAILAGGHLGHSVGHPGPLAGHLDPSEGSQPGLSRDHRSGLFRGSLPGPTRDRLAGRREDKISSGAGSPGQAVGVVSPGTIVPNSSVL